GWYGVFATEIAAMGKPVVTSIAPEYVAASGLEAPPRRAADEATIVDVLRDLAHRREELPAMGARAREFVLGRHSAVENARRVVADYADGCGSRAAAPQSS
ncbi:MAG: glycosyltransferase family 4 protein, partial [Actinobacteria bacterium]